MTKKYDTAIHEADLHYGLMKLFSRAMKKVEPLDEEMYHILNSSDTCKIPANITLDYIEQIKNEILSRDNDPILINAVAALIKKLYLEIKSKLDLEKEQRQ